MPIEGRLVSRFTTDCSRNLDRLKSELRDVSNAHARLGSAFNNDQRFTKDAYALKDEVRQVERAIEKLKDRFKSIERNNR